MKIIIWLIILLPAIAHTQILNQVPADSAGKGIHFDRGLNWQQVLTKSKAENKYIFVDSYTTWCGPCKEMERAVYPLEKVGEYFNDRFISIKVQMDTSRIDDNVVKSWYADAHYILKHYSINGYPTFLFFTPDGRIINRAEGTKEADDFIKLGADVINPERNYYTLLKSYQHGKRDLTEMNYLARRAFLLGDTTASQQIAQEYVSLLKNESLLTPENVEFMYSFTKTPKDKGFSFFYQHADSIDKIMGSDTYAQQFLQIIIYKEFIVPELEKAKKLPGLTPDWVSLRSKIKRKYNAYYSDRVITAARSSWGLNHNDKPEYTKYLVHFVDVYGSKSNNDVMTSLSLNNYAWAVFLNSNSKEELIRALSWSSRAVMMCPSSNWMDTYANILYKLGRNKESIMWEEVASKLSPDDRNIQTSLEKMRKGVATWSVK